MRDETAFLQERGSLDLVFCAVDNALSVGDFRDLSGQRGVMTAYCHYLIAKLQVRG